MGLYMYISDADRVNMRKTQDPEVCQLLAHALRHDPSLMVSESSRTVKNWFGKTHKFSRFAVYHECFQPDGSPAYEARQQYTASGEKQVVIAYLYGIINGSNAVK